MDLLLVLLTGLALAMDCFAVAICVAGTKKLLARDYALLPLHFGVFQGGMVLCGALLGSAFHQTITAWDHWIAFCLLSVIGVKMIIESRKPAACVTIVSEWQLLALSIATSIDALVVGFAFTFLGDSFLSSAILIGAITLLVSLAGLFIGKSLSKWRNNYADAIGGIVLIGIGVKILVQHLI